MADQTITPQTLTLNGQKEVAAADYEDLTAANDGIFTVPQDGKWMLHVIDAAGGAIVTLKAGDGIKGGQGDLVFVAQTIALNNFYGPFESARFKWLTEDDGIIAGDTGMLGKVRVQVSAAVKAAVIVLP